MKEITYTTDEIPAVARQLIKEAKSNIVLFYAEMGVGKTTLIKEIVRQLGSEDPVSSPTFSIVNEYRSPQGPVYHFDFYRIHDETEALDIGVEEYFDSPNRVFIEWPEKIEHLLPADAQAVYIKRGKGYNILTF